MICRTLLILSPLGVEQSLTESNHLMKAQRALETLCLDRGSIHLVDFHRIFIGFVWGIRYMYTVAVSPVYRQQRYDLLDCTWDLMGLGWDVADITSKNGDTP